MIGSKEQWLPMIMRVLCIPLWILIGLATSGVLRAIFYCV